MRDIPRVLDELGLDRIDLMKINIEGGEYDLLERMAEADLIRRVRYFLIQFHEWYGNANVRRWRIRRQLRASHTEVWNYPWMFELGARRTSPIQSWSSPRSAEGKSLRNCGRRRRLGMLRRRSHAD